MNEQSEPHIIPCEFWPRREEDYDGTCNAGSEISEPTCTYEYSKSCDSAIKRRKIIEEFAELRHEFLTVFLKKKYKKRTWSDEFRIRTGAYVQPEYRGRFIDEANHPRSKYQVGAVVKLWFTDIKRNPLSGAYANAKVIGRYYTPNYVYKNSKARVLILDGPLAGSVRSVGCGPA